MSICQDILKAPWKDLNREDTRPKQRSLFFIIERLSVLHKGITLKISAALSFDTMHRADLLEAKNKGVVIEIA